MAHIADDRVVVLAPEEWCVDIRHAGSQHVAGGRLPQALRHHPVLDPDALAARFVRPAGDVAGGVDIGCAGLEVFVYQNPMVHVEAGRLGQRRARAHADAYDDQVGGDLLAILQGHPVGLESCRRLLQMKRNTPGFVKRADEVSERLTHHPLQGPCLGRDDMNLDVTLAQRRRDFQADEARSDHDCALCASLDGADDRLTVGLGAQVVNLGQIRARDLKAHGLGAGCQQQCPVLERLPIGQLHLGGVRTDRRHGGVQA